MSKKLATVTAACEDDDVEPMRRPCNRGEPASETEIEYWARFVKTHYPRESFTPPDTAQGRQ